MNMGHEGENYEVLRKLAGSFSPHIPLREPTFIFTFILFESSTGNYKKVLLSSLYQVFNGIFQRIGFILAPIHQ